MIHRFTDSQPEDIFEYGDATAEVPIAQFSWGQITDRQADTTEQGVCLSCQSYGPREFTFDG